jgi:hypothetical protein
MAAVLTCFSTFIDHYPTFATDPAATMIKTSLFLGTFIGGVTFTGIRNVLMLVFLPEAVWYTVFGSVDGSKNPESRSGNIIAAKN